MTEIDLPPQKIKRKLEPSNSDRVHPWRICPLGKHFVRTHIEHVPPSNIHPQGTIITPHEHCAENSSKKDILSFDEIKKISEIHFVSLDRFPKLGTLKIPNADKYDDIIRGWTHFWNEIFHPDKPLDPNLVKALIASESTFDPKTDNKINKIKVHAYGLMQLRMETLRILKDHEGELRDYLVNLTHEDAYDPSANICAGIRWLFRKKEIVTAKFGHDATWDQAVAAYKSYLGDKNEEEEMDRFHDYYKKLQEGQ